HSVKSLLLQLHQQPPLLGYATDRRQMIPRQRHTKLWRLTAWGIATYHSSQQVKTCFVYPYDSSPFSSRLFLSAGQRLEYQEPIAASSRWLARRIGFCGLHPICASCKDATDVSWVVTDAKLIFDEAGYAATSP